MLGCWGDSGGINAGGVLMLIMLVFSHYNSPVCIHTYVQYVCILYLDIHTYIRMYIRICIHRSNRQGLIALQFCHCPGLLLHVLVAV